MGGLRRGEGLTVIESAYIHIYMYIEYFSMWLAVAVAIIYISSFLFPCRMLKMLLADHRRAAISLLYEIFVLSSQVCYHFRFC